MHEAGHAESVLGLVILHGMTAHQDCSRLLHLVRTARQDISQNGRVKAVGESHDIQRHLRHTAHGVDIAQRVGRRDLSEHIGVIYNRGKEIHGLNHRHLIVYAVHRRII